MKEDPKEGLVSVFYKITRAPVPTKNTLKHKKLMKESVEWLRVKNPGRLDMVDDITAVILLRVLIVLKMRYMTAVFVGASLSGNVGEC